MGIADAKMKLFLFNSLWSNGAIWWHKSGSEIAQVMATSHYLDQAWMELSRDQWHSPEINLTAIAEAHIQYKEF